MAGRRVRQQALKEQDRKSKREEKKQQMEKVDVPEGWTPTRYRVRYRFRCPLCGQMPEVQLVDKETGVYYNRLERAPYPFVVYRQQFGGRRPDGVGYMEYFEVGSKEEDSGLYHEVFQSISGVLPGIAGFFGGDSALALPAKSRLKEPNIPFPYLPSIERSVENFMRRIERTDITNVRELIRLRHDVGKLILELANGEGQLEEKETLNELLDALPTPEQMKVRKVKLTPDQKLTKMIDELVNIYNSVNYITESGLILQYGTQLDRLLTRGEKLAKDVLDSGIPIPDPLMQILREFGVTPDEVRKREEAVRRRAEEVKARKKGKRTPGELIAETTRKKRKEQGLEEPKLVQVDMEAIIANNLRVLGDEYPLEMWTVEELEAMLAYLPYSLTEVIETMNEVLKPFVIFKKIEGATDTYQVDTQRARVLWRKIQRSETEAELKAILRKERWRRAKSYLSKENDKGGEEE